MTDYEKPKQVYNNTTHLYEFTPQGKREKVQNITRFYVSKTGGKLIKTMPPTKKMIEKWENGDHYQHETTGEYQVTATGKKPKSGKFKPVVNPDLTKLPPREIGIQVGQLVTDCSSIGEDQWSNLDYQYYIHQAEKLVNPLLMELD